MSNAPNLRFAGVAGYFTAGDGYRHAIVASHEGRLYEIFFKPSTGKGQSYFGAFPAISGLAGFYTPDDDYQHLIVARPDGFIEEVYFQPNDIHFATPIWRLGGIVGIDGFYSDDDQFRHLIVATNNGDVHEIFYHPSIGSHLSRPPLVNFAGIVGIAAFYTPDDGFRHVIVATKDGNIREVFYSPAIGVHVSQPPLVNLPGVVAIGAFYTPDDQYRHVIAVTHDGNIHEVFYHPSIGSHLSQPPLAKLPGANSVAGFYTDDDHYRHAIVGTDAGDVFEIFYDPSTGSFVSRPPLGHFDPTPPSMVDLAPDPANVTAATSAAFPSDSVTGQVVRAAGEASALYVVTTVAGVWKSSNGGAWQQLHGAPGNGGLIPPPPIAVDPANSSHVALGAADGVWESTNGGGTWTRVLDPRSLGCGSSFVSALAFSPASTLHVGMQCGIASRLVNGQFKLSSSTAAPVTGMVASQTQVWARTTVSMLFTTNDGASWSKEFNWPNTISIRFNEFDSLAAVDGFAYIVSGGNDQGSPCGRDNRIVVFNAQNGSFKEVPVKFIYQGNLSGSCDGTGSGITGHKFVKSFVRQDNIQATVGKKLQIFYCAGQEILQADGINADGTVTTWTWILGTQGYSGRDPVHADPWDFVIDTRPGGKTAWIVGDGGPYAYQMPNPYDFAGGFWTPEFIGLHAHEAITLSVMHSSPISRSRLAYPTSHNNGWSRTSTWTVLPEPQWDLVGAGGDVNWTNSDSSSPRWALLARQQDVATLMHFHTTDRRGITLLNLKKDANGVPLSTNIAPGGPLTFQFIQAPKSAGRFPGVDAVMAVDLPITKPWDGATNPVMLPNSPLGQNSNGAPVLIRNRTFDANPDVNVAQAAGWAIEIPSFPANAMGIFVTGDRSSPVYYTFTQGGQLFRWNGASWGNPILTGLAFNGATNGVYGSAFANPYDRTVLYAITGNAIMLSTNGGSSFAPENALTALVTANGKLPTTSLSHMAFHYEDPDEVVAGCTNGVFYSRGGGKWTDLTAFVPKPMVPTAAVGIDSEFIYVAANGRSPIGIRGFQNA
jgi:hypothetical protein